MSHLCNIKTFALIAEEGAITRAARRLNISAATASAYLNALETYLGGKLFIRSTRKLTLTDLGRLYLERVRPIMDEIEAADRVASSYQDSPKGLLKVTTGASIGRLVVAPALGQFKARHPDLKVHINLDDSFRSILSEGYHLAFRVGMCDQSNLVQRKIAPNQRVLIASPEYIAQAPPLRTPEDLRNHTLLLHAEDEHSSRAMHFRVDGVDQECQFEGDLTSNSSELPRVWAMKGYGVAQKSFWEVADAIESGQLVRLLRDYEPKPLDLYAVSPFRSGESVKVDMFIDFLRARLREFSLILS